MKKIYVSVLSLCILIGSVNFTSNESYATTNGENIESSLVTSRATEEEFFNTVISGSEDAVNNNLSRPMSAWKITSATLKRSSQEKSIPYDIRLGRMYTGVTASVILVQECIANYPPNDKQWILMGYYLKNKGSEVLKASDVIDENNLCTSSGDKIKISDAVYNITYDTPSVYDLELKSGESGYCWIGVLIPKSVGFPYLKINNGYSNNKENISWINTNPKYVYTSNYKITFNPNGGNAPSKSSINIVKNKAYGKLPTCKRKGYIFKGWYTATKGGSKVSEKTICKGKATVYAQWIKVSTGKSSIYSLSPGKNLFVVKWSKVSGASGYEVCYSTSSKFTSSKKINTNSSTFYKKMYKLPSNKRYYVKIRAYKKDSTGSKVYGSWSSVKTVKTK